MEERERAWPGWITFASVMMIITGIFNIIQGFAALLARTVAYVDTGRLVIVNLTAWGWLAIISGALLTLVGFGLLARSQAARVAGIVLVALHALVQLGALPAYPVWSVLMVALDVVVLFALTVHWDPVGNVAEWEEQPSYEARVDRARQSSMTGTGTPHPAH